MEALASGAQHQFEVKTLSAARWAGTGDRTVRVVIVRPLSYRPRKGSKLLYRHPAYLICTAPDLPLADFLQAYLWRWEIELNFKEEKTTLGMGEAQTRTIPSVEAVPAQLWNIAVDANKPHFDSASPRTRTRFYSDNSLNSAVCYAGK